MELENNFKINEVLKEYGFKQGNKVDFAAKIGRLDLIKILIQIGEKGTEKAIDFALKNSDHKVLEYLRLKDIEEQNKHLDYAVIKGYKGTENAIDYVAKNGSFEVDRYLKVLEYLHNLGYRGTENDIKGTKKAIINAVKNGRIEVLEYLHNLGYRETEQAFHYALEYGHLEDIKVQKNNDYVAKNDHFEVDSYLKVLEYLHSIGYKGTEKAITNAVINGRIEVLEYLHSLGYRGAENAIYLAVKNDNFEVDREVLNIYILKDMGEQKKHLIML
ncbi:uncharacterized protein LOC136096434 [Hydra vulgaris]|uniref:uncharacterized protein LOC136095510 n=1 Tax=Hydra vulgaris TaxID=6087 RepID=UPI0032EA7E61